MNHVPVIFRFGQPLEAQGGSFDWPPGCACCAGPGPGTVNGAPGDPGDPGDPRAAAQRGHGDVESGLLQPLGEERS